MKKKLGPEVVESGEKLSQMTGQPERPPSNMETNECNLVLELKFNGY